MAQDEEWHWFDQGYIHIGPLNVEFRRNSDLGADSAMFTEHGTAAQNGSKPNQPLSAIVVAHEAIAPGFRCGPGGTDLPGAQGRHEFPVLHILESRSKADVRRADQ